MKLSHITYDSENTDMILISPDDVQGLLKQQDKDHRSTIETMTVISKLVAEYSEENYGPLELTESSYYEEGDELTNYINNVKFIKVHRGLAKEALNSNKESDDLLELYQTLNRAATVYAYMNGYRIDTELTHVDSVFIMVLKTLNHTRREVEEETLKNAASVLATNTVEQMNLKTPEEMLDFIETIEAGQADKISIKK